MNLAGRGEGGFSLVEIMVTLALLGLLLTAAWPALASGLWRSRVTAAAHEVAGQMSRLRSQAIAERRSLGMRITRSGGRYHYAFYADGDFDGIRSDDIASGRDPLIGGPRDLPSRYEGVDFGLLDIAIPAIPPRRGTVAPGDDPVRFGRSDTITFTPRGTASSGTLFVSDGRSLVVAVVLYGHTGRVRTWRYLRDGGGWSR